MVVWEDEWWWCGRMNEWMGGKEHSDSSPYPLHMNYNNKGAHFSSQAPGPPRTPHSSLGLSRAKQ